jgi:histidinol-phosphate aminotransferase
MSNTPQPKPYLQHMPVYTAGKSTAAPGKRVIKLSSNESPLGPSPKALAAYAAHAEKLHRYPDSAHADLRAAIAEVHGVDAARLVCGAGSDELIGLLVHAYAGEGDEVLYSEHGFLMYKIYTQSFGATPVAAPEKNLRTDVQALLARVTPRTKLVLVANPNNPTGSYLSASEMNALRAGLPPHVVLAVDGAYAEYATAPDYTDSRELVDAGENTVMLRTFSKIHGLPSLRVGWGYFPEPIARTLNSIRGPFNVSGAGLAAAAAAMRDVAFTQAAVAHNTTWRPWLAAELAGLGLKIYPSEGNFLLAEFPAGMSAKANDHLLSEGIIVRDVANYGLPSALRITVGTEEENKALVKALRAFL